MSKLEVEGQATWGKTLEKASQVSGDEVIYSVSPEQFYALLRNLVGLLEYKGKDNTASAIKLEVKFSSKKIILINETEETNV